MTDLPMITIVSACFNLLENGRVQSFERAVKSVQAQSHPRIEHLVIDGASRDGTTDMLRAMAANGAFDRLITEPDRGVYDAMNKGYFQAKGDFVGVLNSDDYYHDPDGLKRAAQVLAQTRADYLVSPATDLTPDGPKLEKISRGYSRALLSTPFGHAGLLIRRTVFEQLGGFDLQFPIASDHDLILRLLATDAVGARLKHSFVSFAQGGLSSDRDGINRDRAGIWKKNFGDFAALSDEEWRNAVDRRVVPYAVTREILCRPGMSKIWRRSAWVQLVRERVKHFRGK